MPTRSPRLSAARASRAACAAVTTGLDSSRGRAVVAYRRCRSPVASSTRSNTRRRLSTSVAPEAACTALTFGQPHWGRDQAQIGQSEVEHRPRRGADVLAELRADQDEDRSGRAVRCGGGLSVIHCAAAAPSTNSL